MRGEAKRRRGNPYKNAVISNIAEGDGEIPILLCNGFSRRFAPQNDTYDVTLYLAGSRLWVSLADPGDMPVTHRLPYNTVGNGLDRSENGASRTPPHTANNVTHCSVGADIIRPPVMHNATYYPVGRVKFAKRTSLGFGNAESLGFCSRRQSRTALASTT